MLNAYPDAEETFGYITKANRKLFTDQKSHSLDAAVVATRGANPAFLPSVTVLKTCIPMATANARKVYARRLGFRLERSKASAKLTRFATAVKPTS
jgi:hypothetical protein